MTAQAASQNTLVNINTPAATQFSEVTIPLPTISLLRDATVAPPASSQDRWVNNPAATRPNAFVPHSPPPYRPHLYDATPTAQDTSRGTPINESAVQMGTQAGLPSRQLKSVTWKDSTWPKSPAVTRTDSNMRTFVHAESMKRVDAVDTGGRLDEIRQLMVKDNLGY